MTAPELARAGAAAAAPGRPPAVLHLRSSGGLFGADRVVLDLCAGLGPAGYRAIAVPLVEPGGAGEEFRAAAATRGIPVRPLILDRRLDWRAAGRLRELATSEGASILHGHDYKSNTIIRLAGVRGARRVATLHGRVGTDWKLRLYEALESHVVRGFDRVVCVSERMRGLEELRGLATVVIHNGIDLAPFRPEPGADPEARASLGLEAAAEVVGAVGRLSAEKRIDLVLAAAARLLPARPRLHVLLVGDGPERPALERLAASLGLRDRTHFAGLRPDAAALYRALDVFCMPSDREGLPLALLEALAAARPAVVTPVGGIPEVIGDPRGRGPAALVVAPGDTEALARAIARLLDDPGLRAELGAAGRRRVEAHFSRGEMAEATARLYDELLGRRRAAAS